MVQIVSIICYATAIVYVHRSQKHAQVYSVSCEQPYIELMLGLPDSRLLPSVSRLYYQLSLDLRFRDYRAGRCALFLL